MRTNIERYWRELATAMKAMPFAHLAEAADLLMDCHARGGHVFIAGNGGSAATASHFACDLAKGTRTEGIPGFRVIPLTDNVPLMTAWGNDTSYDRIFAEQLANLACPSDVVVAISASGSSPNILLLAERARELGAITIALTGKTGGKLHSLADLSIRVPITSIEQVEDAHMMVAHSLCVALRERLQTLAAALLEPTDTVVNATFVAS